MKQELKDRIQSVKDIKLDDFCVTFDHQDIIDSRDIQERIDELEGEFEGYLSDLEDANPDSEDEIVAEDEMGRWLDENEDEYVSLMAFKEEVEQYTSEWGHGATIIADTYFEDYAEEFAYDIGEIKRDSMMAQFIDWRRFAEWVQTDYAEITFDGVSYWIR